MKAKYTKIRPKTVINVSRIVTIHYYEFGPSFVFQGETHDFWELVYVDKGSVRIRQDDEQTILRQGQIVFHKPNEFHSIQALDSSPNFFVISFECASPAMAFFEKLRADLDKTLTVYLSAIFKEAEDTYVIPKNDPNLKKLERKANAPLGGEQLIKTYLEQLLIFLLRSVTRRSDPVVFPQRMDTEDPLVNALLAYFADHVTDTVRMEDLCYEFGYSRSYLTRLFRSHTGLPPAEYAQRLKIDRAKQMIRETDLNFTEISARLSFENPQYFSRVFRRITGMTPTEFKKCAQI